MKLKVLRYVPVADYHQCEDEGGNKLLVDLFTDGKIKGETNESIVGKVVTCDYLAPHFHFAMDVSAVEAAEPATQEA